MRRSTQLGVIFVSRLIVGNIQEVVVPWLREKWDDYKDHKRVSGCS